MYRKPDKSIGLLPYLRGKRKGKEAHRLERASMTDAFLADAMEGFETVRGDHASAIKRLQAAILAKSRSGKKYSVRYWMGIAASFLLLSGAGLFLLLKETPERSPQEVMLADLTEPLPITEMEEKTEALPTTEMEEKTEALPTTGIEKKTERKPIESRRAVSKPEPAVYKKTAETAETAETVVAADSGEWEILALSEELPDEENSMKNDISGVVTDESGQPLPGATLQLKGAQSGTVADREGRFEMQAPDSAVIVASFIGYRNSEVRADTSHLLIAMQESSEGLDEVTVVAFGRQKKELIVGSVAGSPAKKTAEKTPEPVIGKRAYRRYLEQQLVRPVGECAGVRGEAVIRFNVDANGRPFGLTVVQSLCPDADREAMRLIAEGCDWVQGTKEATVTVKF